MFALSSTFLSTVALGYTEKWEARLGEEDHFYPAGSAGSPRERKRRKERKGREEAELNTKG